jgi:predicted DNA-binding transcriptional regulator YafY
MEKPEVTTEDAVPRPDDFDPSVYANQVFEMFDGECENVELKCTNDLMSVIVDKFGEHVATTTLGSTHFKATVKIQISPRFYGWVFGFAGKISILGPQCVKEEYKELAKAVLE